GNASSTPSAAKRVTASAAQWSLGTSENRKPVSVRPAMASVQPVLASVLASSLSTNRAAWYPVTAPSPRNDPSGKLVSTFDSVRLCSAPRPQSSPPTWLTPTASINNTKRVNSFLVIDSPAHPAAQPH